MDNQMTSTMKLCDLVLPDTTTSERWDLVPNEYTGDMAYEIMCEQAIDPLYECRPVYDICVDLAKRLGGWTEDTTVARYDHAERIAELRAAVENAK